MGINETRCAADSNFLVLASVSNICEHLVLQLHRYPRVKICQQQKYVLTTCFIDVNSSLKKKRKKKLLVRLYNIS